MTKPKQTDQGRKRTTHTQAAPEASEDQVGLPQKVLITGGAGFIGTNVAACFAAEGCDVTVFDNLSRDGVEENLAWLQNSYPKRIRFLKQDVRDQAAVRKAVAGCDAVFHFAAQVAVTTSLEDPRTDFEINAQGTLNLLEACRQQANPPALLFTSTNKIYGNLNHFPLKLKGNQYVPIDSNIQSRGVDEFCPLDFHSPYGCSKGTADQYVLDYARCYRLPAIVFRMSCIYGPHQCGTEDQGWVAHFVRRALNEEPIVLYGNGCQVRDLLYVEDLVNAMKAAISRIDMTQGEAFNVGGGPANAVSLLQVLDRIGELHGHPLQVHQEAWRQGDQRYYVSNTGKLRSVLGWSPQVSVEDGVGQLFEWLKSHQRQSESAAVH